MCVVSMIMQHYHDKWWEKYNVPAPPTIPPIIPQPPFPSKEEITEFRKLLEKAREYDRKHNQPDCELEEKRQQLLDLATKLGVEIDFV